MVALTLHPWVRGSHDMNIKTKTIICLLMLCIVDMVIPIPILGLALIYIVVQTPPGFTDIVRRVYDGQR